MRFVRACGADYDYTLIDSRTGLSDVADICTLHLPDVLVDCYTLSDQGIDGAATVARKVAVQTATGRIGRSGSCPSRCGWTPARGRSRRRPNAGHASILRATRRNVR